MKISKHVHSCLLVEDDGKVVLIDPGEYTYNEKALDISKLENLDLILYTHEHPDHFFAPFLKESLAKFPGTSIITNSSIVEFLKKENIEASSAGNDLVELVEVPHEHVFGVTQMPKNVLFKIFGKLTHPGDSLHFNLETDILALPVQAPWTSLTVAAEKALEWKPKIIVPIHDWHWNEAARNAFYQRLNKFFGEKGIEFKELKTGEIVEV